MVNSADLSGYYCVIHLCPYVNEHLCVLDWHQSLHWVTVQYKVLPVEWEDCVSSHHVHSLPVILPYAAAVGLLITLVWQPHCQGGENKTAGKWRMKRGRVNSVSLCGCVTVRVSREQDFVVILIWFHYGRESECLQTCLILMWQTE